MNIGLVLGETALLLLPGLIRQRCTSKWHSGVTLLTGTEGYKMVSFANKNYGGEDTAYDGLSLLN